MDDAAPIQPSELELQRAFLRRLARQLVRGEAAAEDLVADTLVRALERPPDSARALRAWLASVARHLALNRVRGEQRALAREVRVARAESVASHDEALASLELQERLIVELFAAPDRAVLRRDDVGPGEELVLVPEPLGSIRGEFADDARLLVSLSVGTFSLAAEPTPGSRCARNSMCPRSCRRTRRSSSSCVERRGRFHWVPRSHRTAPMPTRTPPKKDSTPDSIPTGPQRAPRGRTMSCKTWQAEAALRLLMNNLDPEVAEDPANLIVYGGSGKAARDWDSFRAIVATLRRLEPNETLLVQSGKPVGVFKTTTLAPRVLIANSNLVGKWANWEHFRHLEAEGKMMFGQMTAGSWIYIGTQGILQGTYETFAAAAQKHFGGSLKGRLVVSGGLGGMGGAQPLAATMNEGTFLGADVDRARIEKRLKTRYCDVLIEDLEKAIDQALEWKKSGTARSIGVVANVVDLLKRLIARKVTPDVLTDQTSAHDPVGGYVPDGMSYADALRLRASDPHRYERESFRTIKEHVRAMLELQRRGADTFDYGNNLRGHAHQAGLMRAEAFGFEGFVPKYVRPLFCQGKGPFRWVALSGDPADIAVTDKIVAELFPADRALLRWLALAAERVAFQGLPARICWLGYGERQRAGLAFNEAVAEGRISAPIAIGRDHLDCGSVASPNRETENMKDGTDAVADWPLLNCMLNVASGASWVSFHHGGGVGIGYSLHAGQVVVADGTKEAAAALERVLTNDPGTGVMRHADAGYEDALRFARERGIDLPMQVPKAK